MVAWWWLLVAFAGGFLTAVGLHLALLRSAAEGDDNGGLR